MAFSDLSDPKAVLQAVDEYDRLGREAFLDRYQFRPSRSYFLVHEGHRYDSKPIVGAAHGYQFSTEGPLRPKDFSGGEATVATKLRSLGFTVEQGGGAHRNPVWAADELILALDLYLRAGLLDDSDAQVQELSEILNRLPIHTVRPDLERFRNPNGVALKLANFAALDPDYPGTGMSRGGKGDAQTWDRFHGARDELARLASLLRGGETSTGPFSVTPEDGEEEVEEGRLVFRLHRARERSRALISKKKQAARARGDLACEVCGFDFEATYGDLGRDFIECHHVVPLSASGATTTKLADLALLCSNCHRMAHRGHPWPGIVELRQRVTR